MSDATLHTLISVIGIGLCGAFAIVGFYMWIVVLIDTVVNLVEKKEEDIDV